MFSLSKETEQELKKDLLKLINDFLDDYKPMNQKALGLISQRELLDDLDINYRTLRKWEAKGLKRYSAPIENTRLVYYKISDVLLFLGVIK